VEKAGPSDTLTTADRFDASEKKDLLKEIQSRSVELYSEEHLCVRERAEKQIKFIKT